MMQPCVWPLEYDAFECAYANSGAAHPRARPDVAGRTLLVRPAVVRAAHADVQFLDRVRSVRADVADVHAPAGRIDVDAERVAQAVGPDLGQHARRADERVVVRDRAVLGDAQDLPVGAAEVLRAGGLRLITGRQQQRAVGGERQVAAVVERAGELRMLPQHDARLRVRGVADHVETHDARARLGRRREHEDVAGVDEVRIDGDAGQTAFAERRVDLELAQRVLQQLPVLHHEDSTAALADQQPPVGKEGERRRFTESARDRRLRESGRYDALADRRGVRGVLGPRGPLAVPRLPRDQLSRGILRRAGVGDRRAAAFFEAEHADQARRVRGDHALEAPEQIVGAARDAPDAQFVDAAGERRVAGPGVVLLGADHEVGSPTESARRGRRRSDS
jgi:hypothetical protein